MKRYCSYLRASTEKQGKKDVDGNNIKHGLDAQRKTILDYVNKHEGVLQQEYEEIESGGNRNRPILKEALHYCEITGSTLIVAKLDRLARDQGFLVSIMDSGVELVFCDFPSANRFVLQIIGSTAEYERLLIRDRVKAGLAAAKAKGVLLGKTCHQNRDWDAFKEAQLKGAFIRKCQADTFAQKIRPIIETYIAQGITSYSQLAVTLNNANVMTARKKRGAWTAQSVKNIMMR